MRDKFNNYSFWRIKKILENDYHYRLERINQGYKANRRRNFVELYNLIDNNTNSIILKNITLNSLRKILTEEKYPLNDK
ncbi:hypothetical protein [Clostridium saudiense]|uniref:hypothetical protein n=1 Tax=Clostridium saudiense TaxID=1414720 RepID=UPI0018A8FBB7|nr:hypothetical protein [Clostridium saudiense]